MSSAITVLKFGSSVLEDNLALPAVVLEIYRELRRGQRVVAVVSAFGHTTDDLMQGITGEFRQPDPRFVAQILATGEAQSAATLGLALEQAGVPVEVLDARQCGLITCGDILDAEPLELNKKLLEDALEKCPVVILPGFCGYDCDGQINLLGRGGSDLTALFLTNALAADECRLLKDVEGLLKVRSDGSLDYNTRYRKASYRDCQRFGGPLVQPKAVEFAERNNLQFSIARCGAAAGTLVGPFNSSFETIARIPRKIRVAIAGLGTVGMGVYRWIAALPVDFEIVGILVQNLDKERDFDIPLGLLTDSPMVLLAKEPELIIEVIGGSDTAAELVRTAGHLKIPVVSANKQLIATDQALLASTVITRDNSITASASIGGSLPVLEQIFSVLENEPIIAVEGILNGSCNFILDRMHVGLSGEQALNEAQELGFAEADPYLDISGLDSVYKLCLLGSAAFGRQLPVSDIKYEGLQRADPQFIATAQKEGKVVRLVAEVFLKKGELRACVRLKALELNTNLAECFRQDNCLIIKTFSGKQVVIRGKGAGRYPTTISVVSDALAQRRRLVFGIKAVADEFPFDLEASS